MTMPTYEIYAGHVPADQFKLYTIQAADPDAALELLAAQPDAYPSQVVRREEGDVLLFGGWRERD